MHCASTWIQKETKLSFSPKPWWEILLTSSFEACRMVILQYLILQGFCKDWKAGFWSSIWAWLGASLVWSNTHKRWNLFQMTVSNSCTFEDRKRGQYTNFRCAVCVQWNYLHWSGHPRWGVGCRGGESKPCTSSITFTDLLRVGEIGEGSSTFVQSEGHLRGGGNCCFRIWYLADLFKYNKTFQKWKPFTTYQK